VIAATNWYFWTDAPEFTIIQKYGMFELDEKRHLDMMAVKAMMIHRIFANEAICTSLSRL
jgi:hypothetical protein